MFGVRLSTLLLLFGAASKTFAADCKTATVGSPYSTCYDIAVAASINTDQLIQYNPGLNCGTIQIGQKLCVTVGNLPSTTPKPNPDGSCATYKTVENDYCAVIGTKFGITAAQIEQFNANTYKWKGCDKLQVGFTLCVSTGTPPPVPVNPSLQCGPESPGQAKCPLNACCSAYGFCGITSEFCEAAPNGEPCISNCGYAKMPSCGGDQLSRKVGYYAGWAAIRKCNPVTVAQVDLTGFTHIIYAFAAIKDDMSMSFADATDGDRLKQMVAKAGSAVKVTVAVGGWTFSQGSTKDVFSVMIGSSANRAKFIASAKTFIATYGIAGIDIDFEYPASTERGGPPSDTPNLTLFFKELRAGLGSSAIISLATPAGYWFLKGFELDKISPELTFINMMSYDYHGPWDTTVAGANSTAQPQSSLLDMKDSVLLYVKAGVDMKKVNLGLAWYGRTYGLEDATCTGYNCDMKGGGAKGKCTGESGVLANFELQQILIDADARARLDTNSQTKWFNHDGDLVTFDDEDTLKAKTDFAKSTCFGGTMVWSIDQNLSLDSSDPGSDPTIFPVQIKALNTFGAVWDDPPQAGTCYSYGTRIYTARLWKIPKGMDWIKACQSAPIEIKGIRYNTPDDCQDQGIFGGVIGVWLVSSNDDHCLPHWGSVSQDDCVDNGLRKHYSRLWGIKGGVDWMTMCLTTPATVAGTSGLVPTYCDDKGLLGAWGVWEVEDKSCSGRWGSLKDNGCADTLGKREWSSKLFDVVGGWEDACKKRDNTVNDEYFSTPTKCEKHITGIWGVFETMDPTCGVPPCPDNKSWDFDSGACTDCSGKGKMLVTRQAREHNRALDPSSHHGRSFVSSSYVSSGAAHHAHRGAIPNTSLATRTVEKRIKECLPFHLPRPSPSLLPNNGLSWLDSGDGGSNAEGPSAAEIASNLGVQEIFQEAWNDSFPTGNTAQEAGGWIYANPNNTRQIHVRRAQRNRSNSMNRTRPPAVAAGIDLNNPETNPGQPAPAGWVLVANFHTHPFGEAYGGNSAAPSTADNTNAWARGVPGIIIHANGLTGYGPQRRAQLRAPRGYPNPGETYSGQGAAGTRLGTWTPNPAPNQ